MPPKKLNKQQGGEKPLQKQKEVLQQVQAQTQWQVIQNLNKLYKVDRILLKHAYNTYPELQQLQQSKQYKNVEKFYRYTLDNLYRIERDYLMDDVVALDNQDGNNTYQINKVSTSKFIRDQKEHYTQVYNKYCSQHKQSQQQDSTQINGTKLFQFVKQCFNTKYTKVLISGKDYFNSNEFGSNNKQQFENIVRQFYCGNNGITYNGGGQQQCKLQTVQIGYDQILDFLTYWLRHNQSNDLYVLYSRTEEKLAKDAAYLKAKAAQQKVKEEKGEKVEATVHPINLQKEQLQKIKEQINIQLPNQSELKQQGIQNNTHVEIKQKSLVNQEKLVNILEKYGKGSPQSTKQCSKLSPNPPTKKQILLSKLPQLFTFGCKRRYPLPKGTTFQQIQSQSKTMNLQKFINFCNYFEINKYLSRELLSEIFKLNALNRLVLDEKRFSKVMETVIQTDQKCIELLTAKKSIQSKLRSQAKLSNYKFVLRPVNGKSIETLQDHLNQIKLQKSKSKQQKLNLYHLNLKRSRQKYQNKKKQKTVMSSRIFPGYTNIYELQNIRDDKFDPEKFFGNDHDQLLSAYESKNESRSGVKFGLAEKELDIQPNKSGRSHIGLEAALSKRLEKGNKILRKINSSILSNYQ